MKKRPIGRMNFVKMLAMCLFTMKWWHWKSHWKSRVTLETLGTKEISNTENFSVWFQCPWTTKENISVCSSMWFPLLIFFSVISVFVQSEKIYFSVIFSVIVSWWLFWFVAYSGHTSSKCNRTIWGMRSLTDILIFRSIADIMQVPLQECR